MQICQALIIILIIYLSGLLISTQCNSKHKLTSIALAFSFYGLFALQTVRDGFYWYSASVLYLWPLLPLFTAWYLLVNQKNQRKIAIPLLLFTAAFSQEQVAVFTIVSLLSYYCIIYLRDRSHFSFKATLINLISTLLGGTLCILAPGNFIRAHSDIYADYYSQNFITRTLNNYGDILTINFGAYNLFICLILTIFTCLITASHVNLSFKSKAATISIHLFFICFLIFKITS